MESSRCDRSQLTSSRKASGSLPNLAQDKWLERIATRHPARLSPAILPINKRQIRFDVLAPRITEFRFLFLLLKANVL